MIFRDRHWTTLPLLAILAVLTVLWLKGPMLTFKNKVVRVTCLLYCDLRTGAACKAAQTRLTCAGDDCLGPMVKRFYESEFHRVTGDTTTVEVKVVPAVGRRRMTILSPSDLAEAAALYEILISEFHKRNESYFGTDARLFINIVKEDPNDRTESSVGSANGRIGLVEWGATDDPHLLLWNITKVLHELGHIWGTKDHYVRSAKSKFPDGYVEPEKGQASTQTYIDIMSGTRPVQGRSLEAEPDAFDQLRVSPATAAELGWSFKAQ